MMRTFHFQERSSLLRRLDTFNDLEVTLRNSGDNHLEEPISITSLETFSLSYNVHWPLSIVLHPVVIPLFASFKSRSSCDVVLYCQHCINDSSHNHSRIKLSIPCVVNEKGNISLLLVSLDMLIHFFPVLLSLLIYYYLFCLMCFSCSTRSGIGTGSTGFTPTLFGTLHNWTNSSEGCKLCLWWRWNLCDHHDIETHSSAHYNISQHYNFIKSFVLFINISPTNFGVMVLITNSCNSLSVTNLNMINSPKSHIHVNGFEGNIFYKTLWRS
ncbi:Gamma-tubulin complex component 2 [Glycine max]|nr:Gamma-tubulin complex component 2 [Glycine max]